ncbi:MAG: hypothetical protein ACYTG0_43205, partial [Planctomycetota bacterium]
MGYALCLLALAIINRRHEVALPLEDLREPIDWMAGLLLTEVLAGTRFLVLGFLAALASRRPRTRSRGFGSLRRWLSVFGVGIGCYVVLSLIESGRLSLIASVLPLTGYLIGVWIGFACDKGLRATLWLLPKLALLLVALGAGAVGLVFMAVEGHSLPFEPPKVTSAEKRRLAEVIRAGRVTQNGFRRLHLSERDVNVLVTMAMAHASSDGKARIRLDRGYVDGELSVRIGRWRSLTGYVNIQATLRASVTSGQPEIDFRQCRVGDLPVPSFVLDEVSRLLTSAILDDPDAQEIVAAIDSARVDPEGVEFVFRSADLDDDVIPSLLARLGQKPEVLAKTRAHLRHLVRAAETLPEDGRFEAFLQTAFELAQKGSRNEDPVLENRAAILALAILLGHHR